MALRHLDSVAHYVTADIGQKYPSFLSATVNAGSGRFGGASLRFANAPTGFFAITRDNQATWVYGMALKASTNATAWEVAEFRDGTTVQVSVYINANGTVSAYRGTSAGTLLGTSSLTVNPLAYPFIEIKTVINNTTGSVVVKANETTILSLTSQNTRASANNQANEVRSYGQNAATVDYCDLYLLDGATGTGAANNDFWGDTRVDAKFPTGTGTTDAWAANGAANGWDCVNDAAPDGDTTYISSATVNQVSTFVTEDVAAGATVRGVQHIHSSRKDDAGTRTVAPVLRSGGADRVGANQNLSAVYSFYTQQYDGDPADSAAWTAAKFNALEVGVKEIA